MSSCSHILIIDDQPDNLLILEDLLGAAYAVHTANAGQEALDYLAAGGSADLILLDVVMSDLDGFEVCRRLKVDPATREIPVIFLTALNSIEAEEQGLSLGADDFIHKPFSPPVVLARVRNHLELSRTNRLLRKHGEDLERRVAERAAALQAANQQLHREISQREQTEDALRQSEARFQALLAMASDWFWEQDDQFRFTFFSDGLARVNIAADELLGKTRWELSVDSGSADCTAHRALLEAHQPFRDFEYRVKTASGEHWLSTNGQPLFDASGRFVGYRGTTRDVTQRKQAEQTLTKAQENLAETNAKLNAEIASRLHMELELRLAQKLEAVGQLAAGIAHEINTPIQYIGDSVHFLQTAFDDLQTLLDCYREGSAVLAQQPEQAGLAAAIQDAEEMADLEYLRENVPPAFERTLEGIGHVTGIVRAMKEFAHPDQREKSPGDLNKALLNTLIVARNEYKYVADVETQLGELPPVSCYLSDLNQVFLNLVVNAAHAIADVVRDSPQRGRITLSTRLDGDQVEITIADTGGGIPAAIRDRVYDPFFTTKPVGQGSGQGLAIARSIVVDKHQGTLHFDSAPGQGTTFYIRLPVG
ncbi:ATP-binding protein [Candidatus Contendibacter odensensis]|uniref:histidine kinase n=1 Tax=Candidatus Contendobacter odensis Run_B_J11 TaxID=1400861 RepID=A0A7U7G9P7_9GAMM|nr:ATP-binding protein [Candidatus Contendobacter odensis]CDH44136.1 putative Histidine kinase [Candidatus Contendobacter odensis Run_B_J11]